MNLLCSLARALAGAPPPRRHKETGDEIAARMPVFIGRENPLDTDGGRDTRARAGLKMLDPDCYGFLLVTVHRDGADMRGRVELEAQLQPHWHPAVARTLERCVDELS